MHLQTKCIDIIVADTHNLIRNSVIAFLKQIDFLNIISGTGNAAELINLLKKKHYDVVIIDISMQLPDGINAMHKIKSEFGDTIVIGLSIYETAEETVLMLDAGKKGYLFKVTGVEDIKAALITELNGGVFIPHPEWLASGSEKNPEQFFEAKEIKMPLKLQPLVALNKKELQVIELICEGLTTEQMTARLFISAKSVSRIRERLLKKTKSKNVAQLILYAVRHGIVKDKIESD